MNFPFKEVYEHFALPLCTMDLTDGIFPPTIAIVKTEKGKIVNVEILPELAVGLFFRSSEGKANLGQFIRESMGHIGKLPYCLVLMTEAYYKTVISTPETDIEALGKSSLTNDPEAQECVVITIHTPDSVQMGYLPFDTNRKLKFVPLEMNIKATGRLTNHPEKDDLPAGMNVH